MTGGLAPPWEHVDLHDPAQVEALTLFFFARWKSMWAERFGDGDTEARRAFLRLLLELFDERIAKARRLVTH